MGAERPDFIHHQLPEGTRNTEQTEAQPAHIEGERRRQLSPAQLAHLRRLSEAKKGKPRSPETRARIGEARRGKPQSPETIAKRAATNRGKKRSPETRARIGEAKTGKPRKSHSAETKAKISQAHIGKKVSPESKALMSAGQRRAWENRRQKKAEQNSTTQVFPTPEK